MQFMRDSVLGLLLLGCIQSSTAQSIVKGRVSDTLEKKPLQNAVVSVLKKSDSTLVNFARSSKNGEFVITNVKPDKYVLLITYPKFADFADVIEVTIQPETD